jgi:hypothetical protein
MTQQPGVLRTVCKTIYLLINANMQVLGALSTKLKAFVSLHLYLYSLMMQFLYFILYSRTLIIIVTVSVVLYATCTVEDCLPKMSGT